MIAKTPPMGWNSWVSFGEDVNEQLIKEVADAFVEHGLADAGYEYIVIDDGWSLPQRDKNKRLVPDPDKFPSGIKALSDYVHSKGLKLGIYSCAGVQTCAGYPGSLEHEFIDAETFAEWGIDCLRYVYCYKPRSLDGRILYRRMAMALRNCGRDILLSTVNWGWDEPHKWMRSAGAHTWRSTGDLQDNWVSIKQVALELVGHECYSAPYCFHDNDFLVAGVYGKGIIGLGGCTDEEYKTQFSLWCMMNSPLMIGCDVRNMNEATKAILTNKELIAINQDLEGRQAYTVTDWISEDLLYYVKLLSNGDLAITLVNFGDRRARAHIQFWDLGLPMAAGYGLKLTDLWNNEELGVESAFYRSVLDPHCCQVLRAKVVKL
ncbi:MAG: glycoside hydrolase family 27 protein [Limnochordia bacterium]